MKSVHWKGVILEHDNARPRRVIRTLEKINEMGWDVLLHSPYSPDIAPSDFHLFQSLQHFQCDKNSKMYMICKMTPPVTLLKNQLILIAPPLKVFTLDGKRLLITKVITSLIKNKNKFKKRRYFTVLRLSLVCQRLSVLFALASLFALRWKIWLHGNIELENK